MTTLQKQIIQLQNIRDRLESIIRHPNRSVLDIIIIDYILMQRDIVDRMIHTSKSVYETKNKELEKYVINTNRDSIPIFIEEVEKYYRLLNQNLQ